MSTKVILAHLANAQRKAKKEKQQGIWERIEMTIKEVKKLPQLEKKSPNWRDMHAEKPARGTDVVCRSAKNSGDRYEYSQGYLQGDEPIWRFNDWLYLQELIDTEERAPEQRRALNANAVIEGIRRLTSPGEYQPAVAGLVARIERGEFDAQLGEDGVAQ